MGVLTDFVVANRDEAKLVGETDVPSAVFDGIDAKGIDQVKMATLHSILTQTEYDPDLLATDESFLYTGSEDGPWVQALPDTMIARLADLSVFETKRVAQEWFATEEFQPKYSGWSVDDVAAFLTEMTRLARVAVSENKTVFMWTCL